MIFRHVSDFDRPYYSTNHRRHYFTEAIPTCDEDTKKQAEEEKDKRASVQTKRHKKPKVPLRAKPNASTSSLLANLVGKVK